jgi:hypothetical protein
MPPGPEAGAASPPQLICGPVTVPRGLNYDVGGPTAMACRLPRTARAPRVGHVWRLAFGPQTSQEHPREKNLPWSGLCESHEPSARVRAKIGGQLVEIHARQLSKPYGEDTLTTIQLRSPFMTQLQTVVLGDWCSCPWRGGQVGDVLRSPSISQCLSSSSQRSPAPAHSIFCVKSLYPWLYHCSSHLSCDQPSL